MQSGSPSPSPSLAPDPMRTAAVVEAARKPKQAPDLWVAPTYPRQVAIVPQPARLPVRTDLTHELPIMVADDCRTLARFATPQDAALFIDAHQRLALNRPWTCWLPEPVMLALAATGQTDERDGPY